MQADNRALTPPPPPNGGIKVNKGEGMRGVVGYLLIISLHFYGCRGRSKANSPAQRLALGILLEGL